MSSSQKTRPPRTERQPHAVVEYHRCLFRGVYRPPTAVLHRLKQDTNGYLIDDTCAQLRGSKQFFIIAVDGIIPLRMQASTMLIVSRQNTTVISVDICQ